MGRRLRAAAYTRAMIGLVLAGALLLPRASSPLGPGIAHAAAPQLVWKLGKGTFDPTTKFDEIDSTFTPTGSTYVVEVALVSSDPGDEVYAQLGTNDSDATQVTSGEDRFFAASNLVKGQMPRFVLIADPKHDYGGRTLTFAAAVYAVPDLPLDVSGTAVSSVPNILGFNAPNSGSYTVHYSFDTGSARIVFLDTSGHQQESGTLTGEGGYSRHVAERIDRHRDQANAGLRSGPEMAHHGGADHHSRKADSCQQCQSQNRAHITVGGGPKGRPTGARPYTSRRHL